MMWLRKFSPRETGELTIRQIKMLNFKKIRVFFVAVYPLVPNAAISRKILRHATNDTNRSTNDKILFTAMSDALNNLNSYDKSHALF